MDTSITAMLEHLKLLQSGQDRIERELQEVKNRMSQLEIGVASILGDLITVSGERVRHLPG